jgi:penicillin-binding protein 1B
VDLLHPPATSPVESLPSLHKLMMRRLVFGSLVLACGAVLAASITGLYLFGRWDAVVTERFRTHRWDFPSKIYADGFLIYPGMDLQAVGFIDRLAQLGYHSVPGAVGRKGEYHLDRASGRLDVNLHERPLPERESGEHAFRLHLSGFTVTRIEDITTGQESYSLELEPKLIGGLYRDVWEERRVVTLDEVPPLLLRAIIDVEDQRFYSHHGIDLLGVARAAVVNVRRGGLVQGGSTLTQQLMKNFFLSDERTWGRKLREAGMAVIVEQRFSKEEILENYINEIYLGQRGAQGVFGVWEASRFYFAKQPRELTVAEIAMLAGLIKAPNRYSPFRDADRAQRRRDYALGLMLKQGDITAAEYAAALEEPLRTTAAAAQMQEAPYFLDLVRQELSQGYPADVLTREGLQIYTALDMHLQHLAEETVGSGLADLEQRYPRLRAEGGEDQLQACLMAIEPQTGSIKAMMGGRDYRTTQFNRCTQALRQPGSVFKPIIYLAAFEDARDRGYPLSPTTRVEDEPFTWAFDNQIWTPANYRQRYLGTVTVRQALESSLNAASARLAYDAGLQRIIDMARRMGIRSPLPPYPSVVLGAAEVSPLEVAQAFSVLANGGLGTSPLSIKKVFDRHGLPVERHPIQVERVVSPETAYMVTHIMEGVLDSGTGRGARTRGFTLPAAGKTGTTNDYRDAWFVGFTPNLVAVVWVGFDQKRPLNLAGSEAALPIWTEFMKRATAGRPAAPFIAPPGIVTERIDPLSGLLATPACPRTLDEAFFGGQEPTTFCPLHPMRIDVPPGTSGYQPNAHPAAFHAG